MKIYFKIVVLCGAVVGFLQASNAQTPITIEDEVIYTDFEPRLLETDKFNDQPVIKDTFQVNQKLNYAVNSIPIEVKYEPDTIQPAKMKGEPIAKLQRFFLKAGFGNYVTPLVEFHFNSLRSKNNAYAFRYRHYSSRGNIGGYGFPGMSDNEFMGSYQHFLKNHTVKVKLDYARNVVHYMGYNPAIDTLVREDSTRQRFSRIQLQTSFISNYRTDSIRFNHRIDLDFYHMTDLYRTMENTVVLKGEINKFTDLFASEFLGARLGAQLLNYSNDSTGSTTVLANVEPFMKLGGKKWDAQIGLNLFFGGGDSSQFGIYPSLSFEYKVFRKFIRLYALADGRMERNTFLRLSQRNPFIMSTVPLRNLSTYRFELGVRGAFSEQVSYGLSVGYHLNSNFALFLNDTLLGQRRGFDVVYDQVNMFKIHAELGYTLSEKLAVNFAANYALFSTSKQAEPWHLVPFDATLSGIYNLGDKLIFKADFFVMAPQKARMRVEDPNTPGQFNWQTGTLNWMIDLNIGAEYRLTKSLSFFVNLNNIAAIKYSRFYNYPTQGFNVLGGVTFGL